MPPSLVEKPGMRVAAATDGDVEVLAAGEVDRQHDVADAGAADDDSGAGVVGAVPDRARVVVVRVARTDELTAQALLELGQRGLAERVGGSWLQWPWCSLSWVGCV